RAAEVIVGRCLGAAGVAGAEQVRHALDVAGALPELARRRAAQDGVARQPATPDERAERVEGAPRTERAVLVADLPRAHRVLRRDLRERFEEPAALGAR